VPWIRFVILPVVSLALAVITLRAALRPPRTVCSAGLQPCRDEAGEDRAWAALLLAAILLSPLGWVYYLWIAVWPVAATIGHERPWAHPVARDWWLLPGLAGWLWFRRMAAWGQPSVLATAVFTSMYFWALVSLWWWCVGARRDSASDHSPN
jgi:hypothetical protein